MKTHELLGKARASYKRLFHLLDGDLRNALVYAEIAHEAAHLAEHMQALDVAITLAGSCACSQPCDMDDDLVCHKAEETSPTA